MSSIASAMSAARTAVIVPMVATTISVEGLASKSGIRPRDQVDACGDHRGRVDERRAGSRARHRVRQPDVEGELGALPHRPHEQEQRGDHEARSGPAAALDEPEHGLEGEAPCRDPHDGERQTESHIAEARHHEGLAGGTGGRVGLEPEADEQVRSEPHDLPAHVHEKPAVRDHHADHGGGEERDRPVVPAEPLLVLHVRRASRPAPAGSRTRPRRASAPTAGR